MTIRRRDLLAALPAMAAAATVPRAFAQGTAPVKGGTLRMWIVEPIMLTGAFNSAGQIYQISGKMFDGLVEYDFNLNPTPKLATAWKLSPDAKELTFTLRSNVKWHDGKPFSSADVKFSALEVWRKLHPRGKAIWANLTDVETPDAATAVFKLSNPSPYVMNALVGVESQVLPRHIYEGTNILANPANLAPVGNGPFKFKEWRKGEYLLLERNPDYWDAGRPYLDSIVVTFTPDEGARAVGLEAGELDLAGGLPVALPDARRLAKVPTLEIPTTGYEALAQQVFMELNVRKPYFKDARVRQALYHAIDRDFLLKNIWYGFGKVATGPISSDLKTFYAADVPRYEFSIAKANQLLDEAGLTKDVNGVRLRITHDSNPFGGENNRRISAHFKQQMDQIGIKVDIRAGDTATFIKRVYTDYDFDTTSTQAFGLSDPTIGVQRFYWSKNITPGVAFSNGSGYSNPEVDKLLEAAQSEIDSAKRAGLFHDFQRVIMRDLPILPLVDGQYFAVRSRAVVGTEATPYGIHDNFANVYVTKR
jgi:peptide/nickel transport system substrate-binding protein